MRELSPWLGFCHIRNETDDARSSQQTLVAAWADSVEAFEREVQFHTNTHGLQMILAEDVMPAAEWAQNHPDRKDAQRLAAKVSAKHPVEIGTPRAGASGLGAGGQPDDSQGYLHIEEIKGVEPLDSQFGMHPPKTVPDALYEPLFGQPDPTPSEVAQYGGADKVPPLNTYAILDAAKVVNFVEMLEASGLEHRCLFKGESAEEMRDVAPYVVRLEEDVDFTRNLFSHDPGQEVPWFMWEREPGIYVRSRGSLEEMWRHFRKFTKVQDEDGKWYYFRFWEGEYTLSAFDIFNGAEIATFFGKSFNFIIRSPIENNIKTVALQNGTEHLLKCKLILHKRLMIKFSQTTLLLNKKRMFESLKREYSINRAEFEYGYKALREWGFQDTDIILKLFSLWLRIGCEKMNQTYVSAELLQSRAMPDIMRYHRFINLLKANGDYNG